PVVERYAKDGFVPNDANLDIDNNRLIILTGPNMAGKSTYMRQIALIVLMAHTGSFVPADEANICITERIFTRVGATDNLMAGQSTFMVEMCELANILHNSSNKSLVLLDEIGRGTSTFDGLSIAWAVVEYLSKDTCRPKVLFATHYHELTELEGHLTGVKNYRIAVKEVGEDIIFLRKIMRGEADKSFGIQVARLAGLPEGVISRAKEILKALEASDINRLHPKFEAEPSLQQLSLLCYQDKDELLQELSMIEIDKLSPLEALNLINDLHHKAKRLNSSRLH
ncbi:MAG TPA: DNA mismatch repair protein MutS, partial [Clostridia bacterium]|nr:DNA mismatch repair protein MutS [Clostridia bacterium]